MSSANLPIILKLKSKRNKEKSEKKVSNTSSKGGRKDGAVNYNREVLLDVIESIIPQGANEWNTVALKYKELSHEVNLRAGDQIKSISTKIFARMAKKGCFSTPPLHGLLINYFTNKPA